MSLPAPRARPTLRQDSDKMMAGTASKPAKQAAPHVMAAQGESLIKAFRAAGAQAATVAPLNSPVTGSKIPRSPKVPSPVAVNSTTQPVGKAPSSPSSSKIPRLSSTTAARQLPAAPAQSPTSVSYHQKPCPATVLAVEPCTPTAQEAPAPARPAASAQPSQPRCCSLASADLELRISDSAEALWLSSSCEDGAMAATPAPAAELWAAKVTGLGSPLQQHPEQQRQQQCQWRQRLCSQELELRLGEGPECSWLSAPLDEVFLLGGCCWLGGLGLQQKA